MRHGLKKIMLTTCLFATCVTHYTVYASSTQTVGNIGPGQNASTQNKPVESDESKRVLEILSDLYANETNEDMKRLGIDISAAAICGTNPENGMIDTTVGVFNVIGRYQKLPIYFYRTAFTALNAKVSFCVVGDQLVLINATQPSHDTSSLEQFYKDAINIKKATENMSDYQKASYIHNLICDRLTYEQTEQSQIAVDAWISGKGVCYSYSGLFYLLGTYCGLNVEPVIGMTAEGPHAWNTVMIDGVKKIIDVTWDDSAMTSDYFLMDEHALDNVRTVYTGNFEEMRALCVHSK